MTKKELIDYLESEAFRQLCEKLRVSRQDFTCYGCSVVEDCEYAYDTYNLVGGCLAT